MKLTARWLLILAGGMCLLVGLFSFLEGLGLRRGERGEILREENITDDRSDPLRIVAGVGLIVVAGLLVSAQLLIPADPRSRSDYLGD